MASDYLNGMKYFRHAQRETDRNWRLSCSLSALCVDKLINYAIDVKHEPTCLMFETLRILRDVSYLGKRKSTPVIVNRYSVEYNTKSICQPIQRVKYLSRFNDNGTSLVIKRIWIDT